MTDGVNPSPRSVLVTGAGVGFGPAITLALAQSGFLVYAGVADEQEQLDLEAELRPDKHGVNIVTLTAADQASADQVVASIAHADGGLYGLVNNDTRLLRGYFEDLADAEIRRVFETNLFGAMSVTRAALPHMRRARSGRIAFITSVAGRIAAPSGSAYGASRFAQEGFAEALYQEVAPMGIYVSMIEPGLTMARTWMSADTVGAHAADPDSPYHIWFDRTEQLFQQGLAQSGLTPQAVAEAVQEALTVPRPRLRYPVGRRARTAISLKRYLPGRLFERLYFGEVIRRITRLDPDPERRVGQRTIFGNQQPIDGQPHAE